MDRAKFMARLQGAAVKLTPFTPAGWDEPIYLRPMSMADIKDQLQRPESEGSVGDRLKADPYYIERQLARVVRGKDGALLFDPADDAQMAELKTVLDASPPEVSRQIQDEQGRLNGPAKSEADDKGN